MQLGMTREPKLRHKELASSVRLPSRLASEDAVVLALCTFRFGAFGRVKSILRSQV